MAANRLGLIIILLLVFCACRQEGTPLTDAGGQAADGDRKKQTPLVVLQHRARVMTPEQKAVLGFPPEIFFRVERAAGSPAEPFYEEVMMRSENLKGDVMISSDRLSGFSVSTNKAARLIAELSPSLRAEGFLIFVSEQNFGRVPDVVTIVRGKNSYDILKIQNTEAPHYNRNTAAIIRWLRDRQKEGSFVITGAGADWVQAEFITQPRNMRAFAQKIAEFAPDVLRDKVGTVDRLTEHMKQMNGFMIWWD